MPRSIQTSPSARYIKIDFKILRTALSSIILAAFICAVVLRSLLHCETPRATATTQCDTLFTVCCTSSIGGVMMTLGMERCAWQRKKGRLCGPRVEESAMESDKSCDHLLKRINTDLKFQKSTNSNLIVHQNEGRCHPGLKFKSNASILTVGNHGWRCNSLAQRFQSVARNFDDCVQVAVVEMVQKLHRRLFDVLAHLPPLFLRQRVGREGAGGSAILIVTSCAARPLWRRWTVPLFAA